MKRLLSIAVSLGILAVIYWRIDSRGLPGVLAASHPGCMALSLLMVVPLTLVTAWRLQQIAPPAARLGASEANRLILLASVLNVVLPSKMGDIAKAAFMREKGRITGSLALALVVFEKACDMLSLLAWCALGLTLYPRKDGLFWGLTAAVAAGLLLGLPMLGSRRFARRVFALVEVAAPGRARHRVGTLAAAWREVQEYLRGSAGRRWLVGSTSVGLWLLHLVQIWLFILALRAWAPFAANLALAPLAILAGLLPLTFAGVGTRDAALILLYRPFMPPATAAALGLLCTSRYLLPALAGLPLLGAYLAAAPRGPAGDPSGAREAPDGV